MYGAYGGCMIFVLFVSVFIFDVAHGWIGYAPCTIKCEIVLLIFQWPVMIIPSFPLCDYYSSFSRSVRALAVSIALTYDAQCLMYNDDNLLESTDMQLIFCNYHSVFGFP